MSSFKRKFGKYAINNLPLIMILCYGVGYIIKLINTDFLNYLTLNPYAIAHGQVWRIITWLIVPPSSSNLFFVMIMLFFYYSIGMSLERTWGTYQYNVYVISGIIFTVAGAFLLMGYSYLTHGALVEAFGPMEYFALTAINFSTYYVNMSIFLAYAATFPEAQVLLFFIISVKVKWLGIIYGVLLGMQFVSGNVYIRFAMAASLLNFAVFWIRTRKGSHFSPKQIKRRMQFNKKYEGTEGGRVTGGMFTGTGAASDRSRQGKTITRHKCAICGRTELDAPGMQFRFCSKCEGNYEYCEEHLYTHTHIGS